MTDLAEAQTPGQHADAGMTAAGRGELAAAATHFEAAARGFLAAGQRGEARAALSNLAFMRKGCGDYRGALAAADEAVGLFTPELPDSERALILLTRAGVLDRLADPAAAEAWRATAKAMRDQPLMATVCAAHGAGALLPIRRDEAIREAYAAIRGLDAGAPLAFLVGVIGAVGDSAPGAAGTPYLAQATWLMLAHPEACTSSNAPFLEMLAERIGYDRPMAETLCLIGLLLASARRGTSDHPAVMSHVVRILHRSAGVRAIPVETMGKQCQDSWSGDLADLTAALEQLIGDTWLVRRGAAPA